MNVLPDGVKGDLRQQRTDIWVSQFVGFLSSFYVSDSASACALQINFPGTQVFS